MNRLAGLCLFVVVSSLFLLNLKTVDGSVVSLEEKPQDHQYETVLPENEKIKSARELPKLKGLVSQIVTNLRRKTTPNKQLLGGRLPPFIERIVQRIQNYFSVYNPPEYFENSRPPPANEGITLVCSNDAQNDSISCNEANESGPSLEEDDCDGNRITETNDTQQADVNIMVSQTIVQDSTINVYTPPEPQNNNVIVVLESSLTEQPNQDKFYVYVNPTRKQDKNKLEQQTETPEEFVPYVNTTYTVIIRGDKLEEFSNNIDNTDNNELNPDVAYYIQHNTTINWCPRCEELRSVQDANSVPNINLVLLPPNKNLNCTPSVQYYVLKPDSNNNSIFKPKSEYQTPSTVYLPPAPESSPAAPPMLTNFSLNEPSGTKFPSIFNLFKKKVEQPR